jgi:uncharacterized protein involved in response to NO
MVQWHAHEMLFGFGIAVLFGFLLTASKNWVGIRGIHGIGLMILTALWIIERFFFYFTFSLDPIFRHLAMSLFVTTCGAYIALTLIKNRQNDSFKDNYLFLILLVAMVVAKNLLISGTYYPQGIAMTIGLFRLAFVIMFERTLTQFMKNTEGLTLYRNPILDFSIKLFVLASVFQVFMPSVIGALLLYGSATLLLVRWIIWRPLVGFRKFGNATMYMGYLGLVLHFALEALKVAGVWREGTISIHVFTFLCMGLVIPSMLVRISQGHTGRKPEFVTSDKIAISLILVASFFRLLLTLIFPDYYLTWILYAGLLWSASFFVLGIRLIPFLFQKRVDGKIH